MGWWNRFIHADFYKDQTPEFEKKKNEALDGYLSKIIKNIVNKHIAYITYRDKYRCFF